MDFIQVSAKTVDDALTEACVQLGTTSDKLEYEVIEKGSTGFLGIGSRNAVIKVRKVCSVEDIVKDFLDQVFKAMDMEVEILIKKDEENHFLDVELKGADMGILIGKRGQTLDSLQYLTNLAVNKHSDHYYKVKIDTEAIMIGNTFLCTVTTSSTTTVLLNSTLITSTISSPLALTILNS